MKTTCHFWWSNRRNYFQEGNYVHPQLKMLEAYKKALNTWARWVDKNINVNKTRVFFRGYVHTHYRYRTMLSLCFASTLDPKFYVVVGRYLVVCFIFTLIFQFKNWKNKFVKLFNVIAVMGNGTQEEDATEKQNQSLTKIIYPSTLRKWEL